MADLVQKVLEIIREEIVVCSDLMKQVRSKTSLLVTGSVDSILEMTQIEEAFNFRLRELNEEMDTLRVELSSLYGMPPQEFTLTELARRIDTRSAHELQAQMMLLRKSAQELKSVNRHNLKLIERSAHCCRGLMALIPTVSSSYQQSGLFEPIGSVQPTFSRQA